MAQKLKTRYLFIPKQLNISNDHRLHRNVLLQKGFQHSLRDNQNLQEPSGYKIQKAHIFIIILLKNLHYSYHFSEYTQIL